MKSNQPFSRILNLIETRREKMFDKNPFFRTIVNDELSVEQRMLFVPYMLFFSCGGPDVITLLMKSEKEAHQLSFIEKKINAFINEDNFHYNFYLKDLETLGYTIEKFGSIDGIIRHVFAEESIPVRKLVYSLSHYSRQHLDPLVRLTLCELIEAGLYDLFVSIYKKIVKKENSPFAHLHYFGDTHVKLEMNHTVTSWFSGNESDISQIQIPDHLFPVLTQTVDEIMENFNEMYLAFNAIILKGDTIFSDKYKITSIPPIHQITNPLYSHSIEKSKSKLQEYLHAMKYHRVFSMINSIETLSIFMQWHVFAVWDFMSLIKRLQKELTGLSLPWMPVQNPKVARFINEIVLGEETDVLPDGSYASHFELYRKSMKEINASTVWIDDFIDHLERNVPVHEALAHIAVPNAVKHFINSTLTTACEGNVLDVLGSFFYGREDSIPHMFQHLLDNWTVKTEDAPLFVYYLKRHIALDADHHGPALQKIIQELTEDNPIKIENVLNSAIHAVQNRIKLWDALSETLQTAKENYNEHCFSISKLCD